MKNVGRFPRIQAGAQKTDTPQQIGTSTCDRGGQRATPAYAQQDRRNLAGQTLQVMLHVVRPYLPVLHVATGRFVQPRTATVDEMDGESLFGQVRAARQVPTAVADDAVHTDDIRQGRLDVPEAYGETIAISCSGNLDLWCGR